MNHAQAHAAPSLNAVQKVHVQIVHAPMSAQVTIAIAVVLAANSIGFFSM